MNNHLAKRALILIVFGAVFAIALFAIELIFSPRQKQAVSSEPKPSDAVPQRTPKNNPSFSLPPAPPAAPVEQPAETGKPAEARKPATAPKEEPQKKPPDLTDLFESGRPVSEVAIDDKQVAPMLREQVAKNHPDLKLSDREYERLAESIRTFREANLRMNSLERTPANAPAIRQSLQEMATAMQDFHQITGMTQDEFFMSKDSPPVLFGGEETTDTANEKTIPEFLSDPHKP